MQFILIIQHNCCLAQWGVWGLIFSCRGLILGWLFGQCSLALIFCFLFCVPQVRLLAPTSTRRPRPYLSELAELPGDVEYLDERERHGDEAEHEVGDGEVHDEDVAGGAHEGVARHHVDHHKVAHGAQQDHERVQQDEHVAARRVDAGLRKRRRKKRSAR